MFIEERRSAVYIAKILNLRNVRNGGRLWNNQSVLKILKSEKCTGSLVWGRSTNTGIRDFYVMPSVRDIGIAALLMDDDVRLRPGMRLRRLREYREVALSMPG
jgi:hypothetical protein